MQRETLMASNRSLAEYNLSQQPILEAKKNALFEAHRNKAVIQEMYEEYRKKLGTVFVEYSCIRVVLLDIIIHLQLPQNEGMVILRALW